MARPRTDVLAVGDAILDVVTPPLPSRGSGDQQSQVPVLRHLPGGNATNFALAFAALGGRSRFVGAIGRDWAGGVLREAYRKRGVDARLRTSSSKPTGMTMAVTFMDATRHLITAAGANVDLRPSDVPDSWVVDARHLHRAGYWWTSRLIGVPTVTLLAKARKAGVVTSLDIATDPEGWPAHRRKAALSALRHTSIFFGNEDEVRNLSGLSSVEAGAAALLEEGAEEVVVHRGGHGSTAFTRASVRSAKAFPVASANPTGAGDIFNAAFVRASMARRDAKACLRFANAAAAWHLENLERPYPTRRDLRNRFGISLPR